MYNQIGYMETKSLKVAYAPADINNHYWEKLMRKAHDYGINF